MTHPVVTVTTSTGLREAGELLCANGFTALPVVDEDGLLVGIVTEADLIRGRIPPDPRVHGRHPHATTLGPSLVADVMTAPVATLSASADISDAAEVMIDERIRCLPIVEDARPIGILTRRDLLQAAVVHNDTELADEIFRQLARVGNPDRWSVSVQAGVADIEDFGSDVDDRKRAGRLAAAVPGVVQVQVRHQTPDPF
jgi:CBS domain-containing protein